MNLVAPLTMQQLPSYTDPAAGKLPRMRRWLGLHLLNLDLVGVTELPDCPTSATSFCAFGSMLCLPP